MLDQVCSLLELRVHFQAPVVAGQVQLLANVGLWSQLSCQLGFLAKVCSRFLEFSLSSLPVAHLQALSQWSHLLPLSCLDSPFRNSQALLRVQVISLFIIQSQLIRDINFICKLACTFET